MEAGVASFTDAWIETLVKPNAEYLAIVASFTDAWIETLWLSFILILMLSHLLQMRGLKL